MENALPPNCLYNGRLEEFEMNQLLKKLLPPVVRDKELSAAELTDLSKYNIHKIPGTKNSYRGPKGYSNIDALKPLNLELVHSDYLLFDLMDYNKNLTKTLVEFIKKMQTDNVFVGCHFGTDTTDTALMLNQYLNPLSKDKSFYAIKLDQLDTILDFCDEATPAQKKEIDWTEEFETNLRKKVRKKRDSYFGE